MKKALLSCIFGLILSAPAFAVDASLENVDPTPWRLQTYTSATYDVPAVFFTQSLCTPSGVLNFASTNGSEKNRFWNTILVAKLAKKRMYISYDYNASAATCYVTSYAVMEE